MLNGRFGWLVILAIVALSLAGFNGCDGDQDKQPKPVTLGDKTGMKPTEELAENAFTKFYSPVEVTVSPKVPGYELPIKPAEATNADTFMKRMNIEGKAAELLAANGFAVTDYREYDKVGLFYKSLMNNEVPIFVTTDSLLHLYHIQFDKTLKDIEEKEFYGQLIELSDLMQQASKDQYDTLAAQLHEAARLNWAYFTVARKLLDPDAEVPAAVEKEVNAELKLIEAHAGFGSSPIFSYREDYSQYVPRGHYTSSEELKRYFRAMMWYGRITMLIVGDKDNSKAIVSQEIADRQTLQAALLAGALYADNEKLTKARDIWSRIYEVTAFYVGLADDLTPTQFSQGLRKVVGATIEWQVLIEGDTLRKFREQLATFSGPRIYGGTGDLEVQPPFTDEQLRQALAVTAGLRFMGQRFIPDSYMMGKLVTPGVGAFTGTGTPFTMVSSGGGPIRAFPRGLDVLSVLGSERAEAVLAAAGDAAYQNYDESVAELRAEFDAMGPAAWHKNLYWAWLDSLRALLEPASGDGWPTFMTPQAWQDKNLNSVLASWAQLRHDTILYAKQSYTMRATAAPPMEKPKVVGYVEPVPEFYARLLSMAKMTRAGLESMQALEKAASGRLARLEEILQQLLDISQKELANEPLTDEDYDFIKYFGEVIEGGVSGQDEGLETTIIADVHTDSNSSQVLEEGTGYLRLLVVAYKLPEGNIVLGAGPVLSYYEFKHPMADRLTDEAWREMLIGDKAPSQPEWTATFYAPK